ncbi:type I 3-dehydroquinate dehydratase [Paenibacillus wulumuqiensis]|uniref:type I 3-dehydroquinate dehydratase n=1 Tax=Paenibacillus wulumuqiensis TaxID=1567107 RepID=UPI000619583B|nr:type I 3-dehydroquinate dehydratase [Paenibacillus wulumuqiensis]
MAQTIKPVIAKHVSIGEGMPKICVSLIGRNLEEIRQEALAMQAADVDVVEWRVDFYENVDDIEKVKSALGSIRSILPSRPLIFTFRTSREGGEREIDEESYFRLNEEVALTGQVDLVDIELFMNEERIRPFIDIAHQNDVHVIVSNHDFQQTPPKEELLSRMHRALELGADIPKISMMPQKISDVLTLLDATCSMHEQTDHPIITISMSGQGMVTRIAGELFGSALTFGSLRNESAPGQVPVEDLRQTLKLFHATL